jgi:hypothetical protein
MFDAFVGSLVGQYFITPFLSSTVVFSQLFKVKTENIQSVKTLGLHNKIPIVRASVVFLRGTCQVISFLSQLIDLYDNALICVSVHIDLLMVRHLSELTRTGGGPM